MEIGGAPLKEAFKSSAKIIAKKVGLWLAGLIGATGFLFIFAFLLIFILIIGITGSVKEENDLLNGSEWELVGGLSPLVMRYEPDVKSELSKYGLEKYTPLLLAIMQQESKGEGLDPMQSSESYCGRIGCITDPKMSIHYGAVHFKNVLTDGEKNKVDIKTVVQSYNFGRGYINFISKNGGKHTVDKAKQFSMMQVNKNPSYNCGGDVNNFRYPYCYGDFSYTDKVFSYLNSLENTQGIPHKGGFIMPAQGKMTSPFGYRIHPLTGERKLHAGIDIGLVTGTSIYASAGGVVSKVQTGCKVGNTSCGGGWGNHVFVEHVVNGKKYTTNYAHLSSVNVQVGQQVKGGQLIGKSGNTGSSSGPHLHFEIHDGGFRNPVDPMIYINK